LIERYFEASAAEGVQDAVLNVTVKAAHAWAFPPKSKMKELFSSVSKANIVFQYFDCQSCLVYSLTAFHDQFG
jgi:hypothetical protein